MYSLSTIGERASPDQQQGSQLIGCHLMVVRLSGAFLLTTLVDKYAHILVKYLPNCKELVHISVHKGVPV